MAGDWRHVFCRATGGGTGFVTCFLAAAGATLLQAATIHSFSSDPLTSLSCGKSICARSSPPPAMRSSQIMPSSSVAVRG